MIKYKAVIHDASGEGEFHFEIPFDNYEHAIADVEEWVQDLDRGARTLKYSLEITMEEEDV